MVPTVRFPCLIVVSCFCLRIFSVLSIGDLGSPIRRAKYLYIRNSFSISEFSVHTSVTDCVVFVGIAKIFSGVWFSFLSGIERSRDNEYKLLMVIKFGSFSRTVLVISVMNFHSYFFPVKTIKSDVFLFYACLPIDNIRCAKVSDDRRFWQ